ncbi:phosphoethanolamine--lipid A transferase [Alteromonadaceae bacterium BrNp21-10]|nr:phosphoethanolamine--lipid A transferase [Alteromonadaceae bacterium BrNp21-10]
MFQALDKLVPKTYAAMLIYASLYIVLVLNSHFLYKVYTATVSTGQWNWLFLLSVPILLFCLSVIILSWLSLVTFIKPVVILSILISAVLFYATVNYGVIFDKHMIRNMVETDTGEALSYLNGSLLFYITVFGVIPSLILGRYKNTQSMLSRIKNWLVVNLICVIVCGLIASLFYQDYASVGRNNRQLGAYITPFAFYNAAYKFLRDKYFFPPLPFQVLDKSPHSTSAPNTKSITVMVVGETARSKNFSLNGYGKPTNAFTPSRGVKSFGNVTSCGTATAISVPCMFSRLSRDTFNQRQAESQENALDIIHRAGVDVLWIDNNSSCKGVCARVNNLTISPTSNDELCDGKYCFDEILLEELKRKIANSEADNTLIVLHMIGSHGPTYYRRYPQQHRVFTPDCPRSDIQNCSALELENTYDNTIAYTDYVLSKIIDVLNNTDVQTKSMLYISDHGESLGEKGLYLHGFPYSIAPKEQTEVPLLYWSNQLQNTEYAGCIDKLVMQSLSHDDIFDTILGLTQVSSKLYRPELDIFRTCNSTLTVAIGK